MSYQISIAQIFKGLAFKRPLFYAYPLGLRFQLSENGNHIHQFVTAYTKANEITQHIFSNKKPVIVLRCFLKKSIFASRQVLKDLKNMDITLPKNVEYWLEDADDEPLWDDLYCYLNIAYEIDLQEMNKYIWGACARDFNIMPDASGQAYLFDFEQQIMVWLYDDRGMDVVGNNALVLSNLYQQYHHYLLDYDKEIMAKNFAK